MDRQYKLVFNEDEWSYEAEQLWHENREEDGLGICIDDLWDGGLRHTVIFPDAVSCMKFIYLLTKKEDGK